MTIFYGQITGNGHVAHPSHPSLDLTETQKMNSKGCGEVSAVYTRGNWKKRKLNVLLGGMFSESLGGWGGHHRKGKCKGIFIMGKEGSHLEAHQWEE